MRLFYKLTICALAAALGGLAACGDDDETGTTTTGTTAGTGAAGGAAACELDGVGDPTDCATACDAVYACGKLTCDGAPLCPGYGDADGKVSEDEFVPACETSCASLMALIQLVDPTDCDGTVTSLKGANADFKESCENGAPEGGSGGTGGEAEGGAGGAAGGAGGAGGNGGTGG